MDLNDNAAANANFWIRKAKQLQLLVNGMWWMQQMLPSFVGANLLFGVLVFWARHQRIEVELFLGAWLGILVILGFVAGFFMWGRRLKIFDALLRIETALELNNRLTTAQSGHIAWPAPVELRGFPYKIKWQQPCLVMVGSLILFALGWILPLSNQSQKSPLAENPNPPSALTELESWIESLTEEAFIEPKALQELEQAINDLKERPADDWYTAGTLEAAENLKAQTENALASLARELQKTSAMLASAPSLSPQLTPSELEHVANEYNQLLSDLGNQALPLEAKLLEQLSTADFSKLEGIDPARLKELTERSESWAKMCQDLAGLNSPGMEDWGEGYCDQNGRPRSLRPMGEIQRGRGDAEMSYTPYTTDLEAVRNVGISNADLRNATIGDTLRTTLSGATDEAVYSGLLQGGAVDSLGSGGDAVWVDRLKPAERKILQQHFK